MDCKHCGVDVGNQMVILEDNTIHCYTCGRLKADQNCRGQDVNHFVATVEELGKRRSTHGKQD